MSINAKNIVDKFPFLKREEAWIYKTTVAIFESFFFLFYDMA